MREIHPAKNGCRIRNPHGLGTLLPPVARARYHSLSEVQRGNIVKPNKHEAEAMIPPATNQLFNQFLGDLGMFTSHSVWEVHNFSYCTTSHESSRVSLGQMQRRRIALSLTNPLLRRCRDERRFSFDDLSKIPSFFGAVFIQRIRGVSEPGWGGEVS